MNAREAIEAAKKIFLEIFGEEEVSEVGLEEVDFDDNDVWNITIGFRRPWQRTLKANLLGESAPVRTYKIVRIRDADGALVNIRHREVKAT